MRRERVGERREGSHLTGHVESEGIAVESFLSLISMYIPALKHTSPGLPGQHRCLLDRLSGPRGIVKPHMTRPGLGVSDSESGAGLGMCTFKSLGDAGVQE